jgi:protein-S-isoprenylcysteine O-methyltransferase Ste14
MVIGFLTFSLPFWIASSNFDPYPIDIGIFRYTGWIFIVLGSTAILWCYGLFFFIGKGTSWPFDPPRKLVITGLYRYVRNPMEGSYLLILFGEVLLFESSAIAIYLLLIFFYLHIRQIFIEEPALRRRFGQQYERYWKSVPRWIPSLTAYEKEN